MCTNPNLSRRRQRRLELEEKVKPKRRKPWTRIFFVKGLTSTRRRVLDGIRVRDALLELHPDLSPEPEPFVAEMIADEDVEASYLLRQREDEDQTQEWFDRNPYAKTRVAA